MKLFITIVLAGLLFACGGGGGPLGLFGPPSAKDIAAKPANSSMKDGHFKVEGTYASGATRMSVSGEGVMVLRPKLAIQTNIQLETGTILGRVGADIVQVDGKRYLRIGNGEWQESDDTATSSDAKRSYSYKGEDQVGGDKAWHIQSVESDTTLDEWVRESDGYLLKYVSTESSGSVLTLVFDKFNTGAKVEAPS